MFLVLLLLSPPRPPPPLPPSSSSSSPPLYLSLPSLSPFLYVSVFVVSRLPVFLLEMWVLTMILLFVLCLLDQAYSHRWAHGLVTWWWHMPMTTSLPMSSLSWRQLEHLSLLVSAWCLIWLCVCVQFVFSCVSHVIRQRGVPPSRLPRPRHETVCESCMRTWLLPGWDCAGHACLCARAHLWFHGIHWSLFLLLTSDRW